MQFLENQESNLIINTLLNRVLFQAREDHAITKLHELLAAEHHQEKREVCVTTTNQEIA